MHRFMLLSILLLNATSLADAQVVRTWVASNGNDAAPCTRTLPCRNFTAGIAAVSSGGEVVALDSAGYGPVMINKSVSVISPEGVHAAIAPTSGSAIFIGDGRVTLRNLYLNGNGAVRGLDILGPDVVTMADSVTIDGFTEAGISVQAGKLFLSNSISRNNGQYGLFAAGSSTSQLAVLTIDGCRFEENGAGVITTTHSEATIRDSVSSSNGAGGFAVNSSNSRMSLMNCQASANLYGVISSGLGSIIRMSHSAAVHNGIGLFESDSGQIETQANNFVQGNTIQNVSGVITTFGGT